VKALVFRHSLAREAASAIGGRIDRRPFVSRFAPVRIEDVEEQPLPAEDWVRVETTFSGLCGSGVKQILLNGSRDNPLTALVSFPHVLGHEVVGRRLDTGEPASLSRAATPSRYCSCQLSSRLRHAMSVTGSGGMKSAMRSGPDA
jgi:L-iditol 2-dehydrogenase